MHVLKARHNARTRRARGRRSPPSPLVVAAAARRRRRRCCSLAYSLRLAFSNHEADDRPTAEADDRIFFFFVRLLFLVLLVKSGRRRSHKLNAHLAPPPSSAISLAVLSSLSSRQSLIAENGEKIVLIFIDCERFSYIVVCNRERVNSQFLLCLCFSVRIARAARVFFFFVLVLSQQRCRIEICPRFVCAMNKCRQVEFFLTKKKNK